ncbi:helix-turn-helix transcriptional regulator [Rhodobacteraceae bacterium KMM 6894]|nr:helix-turn-helix transcriptional regulator [Rhodobacteraceae bacterium KMM 6894]
MTVDAPTDWFDPDVTTFGDRLTGARERAGMTQSQLAKRLGVKKKTLDGWENDLSDPRANHLSILAGLLNVSLLWLMSGEGEGPGDPALSEMPEGAAEILGEIRDISALMVRAAARLARAERRLKVLVKGQDA